MRWLTTEVIGLDYSGRPIFRNVEAEMNKVEELNKVIEAADRFAKGAHAKRIADAAKYTPATYAVLLGTLTSHPDFEGIHRIWHWNQERQDYCSWVVTLWPNRLWHHHTDPKPSVVDAILEALTYLENPVDPRSKI